MNVRAMRLFARSIVRENQMLDAHLLRWINEAYNNISRAYIIPRLQNGDQVILVATPAVSGNNFYLPYDFSAVIAFVDNNGRSLDPIRSMDVRQFGEYNSFGSFVAFYEHTSANITPLANSGSTPITIGVPIGSSTVTASAPIFLSTHVGEWLLPTSNNTASPFGNPGNYAYRIATFTDTTHVILERPFRGVFSDAGSIGDLLTSYFEIRPQNTPIIRIWGVPSTSATIKLEYQRKPSQLLSDSDIPEDDRLSEAIVIDAIKWAAIGFRNDELEKSMMALRQDRLANYMSVNDRDKLNAHNFLTANPMARGYSQLVGMHLSARDVYDTKGVNY